MSARRMLLEAEEGLYVEPPLRITRHARLRMEERKISMRQLLERDKNVVVVRDSTDRHVLTVYRAEKREHRVTRKVYVPAFAVAAVAAVAGVELRPLKAGDRGYRNPGDHVAVIFEPANKAEAKKSRVLEAIFSEVNSKNGA